ncbi:hypothetical protein DPMN_091265 [Dreissena polymorpha]|uniref:Uncharacterized protein n=1 Tax=Dreissena polymorpha TaxID=45954 RepID=A0A9D4QZV3_DREPO|nr:hypothetical protein DPMN_091265 [Dreissena polymorpha]
MRGSPGRARMTGHFSKSLWPLARARPEKAYGSITARTWRGYVSRPIVSPSQGIANGSHLCVSGAPWSVPCDDTADGQGLTGYTK